jgi:mannose-6-phosphate isomerase-like protein (cupin superfamily)
VLSVLRDSATLHEEDGDARASLHLLEGRAVLAMDADEAELESGEVAVVDAGNRWQLRATGDCVVLLTLAWPREKAGG